MEFRRKNYPSLLRCGILESAIDKKELNITLISELRSITSDIKRRLSYLHLYWYNLKYFVHALHGCYRLLYKNLYTFGDSYTCKKCHYHDLIHGPRPIAENVVIFSYLLDFIDLQFS